MRFLLKVAFWLTIVVLLLPADPARKDGDGRGQVGAIEAFGVAQAAVEDASEFCARRPGACETGSQAFQTFGQKAQHGAKMLYEFLSDRFADDNSSTPRGATRTGAAEERPGRHTLMPRDMIPGWNGPGKPVPVPPRRPA
jgi:hypothetical protein